MTVYRYFSGSIRAGIRQGVIDQAIDYGGVRATANVIIGSLVTRFILHLYSTWTFTEIS